MPAEHAPYQTPSRGIIMITIRQGPDAVKMIGQQNNCIYLERMTLHDVPECIAEQMHVFRDAQDFSAFERDHSKEICSSSYAGSSIFHGAVCVFVGFRCRSTQPTSSFIFFHANRSVAPLGMKMVKGRKSKAALSPSRFKKILAAGLSRVYISMLPGHRENKVK